MAEPSASSSVDSNTSWSVWSNLYLVGLVDVFLCGVVSIEVSVVGDGCPSRHLFEIECHVLLKSLLHFISGFV